MWYLRNKTDELRGKKKEREENHERDIIIENKLRVVGGEVGRRMG